MKYVAIKENRQYFKVKQMCTVLGLHAANFYRWLKRVEKKDEKNKKDLRDIIRIKEIFIESKKTYGYRMIKKQLEKEKCDISEYKVRKIMRENGLYPETLRKYKPMRKGKSNGKYYSNMVNQKFKTSKKNLIWVGDITYIRTMVGWVYLAVVIDLFNREVIGYSISKRINTELVKEALGNAIIKNKPKDGLIFHSDRGCQYASKGYQKKLMEHGIQGSMSRPGCPYESLPQRSEGIIRVQKVFLRL